jgi:hypothetical protein
MFVDDKELLGGEARKEMGPLGALIKTTKTWFGL